MTISVNICINIKAPLKVCLFTKSITHDTEIQEFKRKATFECLYPFIHQSLNKYIVSGRYEEEEGHNRVIVARELKVSSC